MTNTKESGLSPHPLKDMSMPHNIVYIDKISQIDGAEMNMLTVLSGLERDKYRFRVILPSSGPFEEQLTKHGIPVKIIKRKKIRMSLNPLYNLLLFLSLMRFTFRLMRIIKKEHIHLVCANSLHDFFYAVLGAKLAHTPLLSHIREILPSNRKRHIWVKLLGFFSDRIVTDSEAVKDMFSEDLRTWRKTQVVHVGVDTEYFSPKDKGDKVSQEFGLKDDDFLVVNIGALIYWKGQDTLIKAAKRIVKEFPRVKFMIVGVPFKGKEEYLDYLMRLTKESGLEANVIFTGFREDIPQILKAADLYVHSAVLPDPFPRALLESMASGKPVIAPRCGGIPELIEDNVNGLLYPTGDSKDMASAIIHLLENDKLRRNLGLAARDHIRENFSIGQSLMKMDRIFKQILKE